MAEKRMLMHFASRRTRLSRAVVAACGLSALLAASVTAGSGATAAEPRPSGDSPSRGGAVITLRTAKVGAPGNPSVGVVPFTDAIYQSCADAPSSTERLSDGRRRRPPLRDRPARGHRRSSGWRS